MKRMKNTTRKIQNRSTVENFVIDRRLERLETFHSYKSVQQYIYKQTYVKTYVDKISPLSYEQESRL